MILLHQLLIQYIGHQRPKFACVYICILKKKFIYHFGIYYFMSYFSFHLKMMNIDFSQDDNYRYKMEIPKIHVEGAGNGIKTAFDNLEVIAEKLLRSREMLIKHYTFSLGCDYIDQQPTILFGKHDQGTITKTLKSFIYNYVLCRHCNNPETKFDIQEKKIVMTCSACGKNYDLLPKSTLPLVAFVIRKNFETQ